MMDLTRRSLLRAALVLPTIAALPAAARAALPPLAPLPANTIPLPGDVKLYSLSAWAAEPYTLRALYPDDGTVMLEWRGVPSAGYTWKADPWAGGIYVAKDRPFIVTVETEQPDGSARAEGWIEVNGKAYEVRSGWPVAYPLRADDGPPLALTS